MKRRANIHVPLATEGLRDFPYETVCNWWRLQPKSILWQSRSGLSWCITSPPGLTINKSFVKNKQSFKSVKNESLLEAGSVMFSATPYTNVCGLNEWKFHLSRHFFYLARSAILSRTFNARYYKTDNVENQNLLTTHLKWLILLPVVFYAN